jgi:hypothetical protein
MLDFGLVQAVAMLILWMMLLLLAFRWLLRGTVNVFENWRTNLLRISVGFCLSAIAVAPIVVSSYSLAKAVGTLDGRFVLGAAVGHAVLITGLCSLPGSTLPLDSKVRVPLRETLIVVLLAIALVNGLGLQRQCARAWQAQLNTIRALSRNPSVFDDGAVLVFLDVPANAFDIRFYYPFTQLVRRFYANPTLHVLPWLQGVLPDQQLLAFGETDIVAVTEIVRRDMARFDYDQAIAFQAELDGELQPVQEIDSRYFCGNTCKDLPFVLPEDWEPAHTLITLNDMHHQTVTNATPSTAWRSFLQSQLDFAARFELP